uniref:Uncharacterized protein LOC117365225 n=1 Tax=Geotrypetes seraphini TaxID=260995 RepID=A0A6P8RZJ1_GEOSA|nr:uncharacterized protein LOC117365225 [Geotrypetes seraphini]
MAPLTATVLALFVLLSCTLADVPQAVVTELSHAESFDEVHDPAHVIIRRAAGRNRKVYNMYHGTSMQAAESIIKTGFRPSGGGMLGPGVYVSTDIRKAKNYPYNVRAADRVILKVRVRVGKVKKINRQGHPLQYTWHARGYDTAWVPAKSGMVRSGLTESCVWDPKRVKVLAVVKAPAAAARKLKSLLRRMKKYHCSYWLVC